MRASVADAAYGAVGFGLGGILSGLLVDGTLWGWGIVGASGGAALGLRARGRVAARLLAITGAIGFFVGFLVPLFVVLTVWEPPVPFLFVGATGGAIGGAALGLPLRSLRAAGRMAVAGAVAFSIASGMLEAARVSGWNAYASSQGAHVALVLGAAATVAGALVGYAFGRAQARGALR